MKAKIPFLTIALAAITLILLLFAAAPVTAQTGPGNALSFDGVDDWVEMQAAVIPVSGDFTVECWTRCPAAPNSHREILSQGSSGNAFYIGINFANNLRLGDSRLVLPLSHSLTGLAVASTYHYRIIAYNRVGLALGNDQSFTTPDFPRTITSWSHTGASLFQFQFIGAAGASYTVLSATNVTLPMSNWHSLGTVTEIAPGQYQFIDTIANDPQRYYRLRWP